MNEWRPAIHGWKPWPERGPSSRGRPVNRAVPANGPAAMSAPSAFQGTGSAVPIHRDPVPVPGRTRRRTRSPAIQGGPICGAGSLTAVRKALPAFPRVPARCHACRRAGPARADRARPQWFCGRGWRAIRLLIPGRSRAADCPATDGVSFASRPLANTGLFTARPRGEGPRTGHGFSHGKRTPPHTYPPPSC